MTQDGRITISNGRLQVPDNPVIPFIEGDGTGPDIWRASVRVFDAAVEKAYGGKRRVQWKEVLAGEKAFKLKTGCRMKRSTRSAVSRRHQGPAHDARWRRHPIAQRRAAAGARSLRLPAARAWFRACLTGEASGKGRHGDLPREHRRHLRRHRIRRRNAGGAEGARFPAEGISEGVQEDPLRHARRAASGKSLLESIGAPKRDVNVQVGIGIKPISYLGTERLVHSAISYAIAHKRKNVTLVHKGNIMKFTEGAFRDWGYKVAKDFFGAVEIDGGPWCRIPDGKPGAGIVIKDAIADITLQQVLTRPDDFDVIATPNLNGDYLSTRSRRRSAASASRPAATSITSRPRHLRSDPRHRAEVRRTRTR